MKKNGHRIIKVNPDSIAWEMGVEPGMYLVSVNGVEIEDVFDYQYLMDEEEIDVLIREENGEETLLEIEKDSDEDFGVEFENSLMDEYRSCCNHCIFCFIDQMPPGMRETLYFQEHFYVLGGTFLNLFLIYQFFLLCNPFDLWLHNFE